MKKLILAAALLSLSASGAWAQGGGGPPPSAPVAGAVPPGSPAGTPPMPAIHCRLADDTQNIPASFDVRGPLGPNDKQPPAKIADFKKFTGVWEGPDKIFAFGTPRAHAIAGILLAASDSCIAAREVMTFKEEDGTVNMLVKQFVTDDGLPLQAPNVWVKRRLVAISANKFNVEGQTWIFEGNKLIIEVKHPNGDRHRVVAKRVQ